MILSKAELRTLTGKVHSDAQETVLISLGMPYEPRGDGTLIVLASQVERLMAGATGARVPRPFARLAALPRKRNKENREFPKRWRLYHGAYFYRVPPGDEHFWDGKKQFRLGATHAEASAEWSRRVKPEAINTFHDALDRYEQRVVPRKKSPATRTNNKRAIAVLRTAYPVDMPVLPFPPKNVYKYVEDRRDKHGRPAKTSAHREMEVVSHMYTKLVEWGEIDAHPFRKEVRLDGEHALEPSTRYIQDWEITEALSLPSKRRKGSVLAVQAAIRIIMLTPMRRADYLQLQPARDFKADGIHVDTQKTGQPTIYLWTPELRAAVEDAQAARPVDIAPWLFCTRKGACYYDAETCDAPGWDSMVQRFMDRVIKQTKVEKRFTLHQVRAKCGSDAESIERARQLLSHAPGSRATGTYRRAPERVVPLR